MTDSIISTTTVASTIISGDSSTTAKGPANIYIAGLPVTVTEEALTQVFMPYGSIESSKIMVDQQGISKGAGFVKFTSHDEATTAVRAVHGTVLHGAEIKVRFAQPRKQAVNPLTPFPMGIPAGGGGGYGPIKTGNNDNRYHPFNNTAAEGHNVYACGFLKTWTKDDLMSHFSPYGQIPSCHVMIDKQTGEGRGAGFLRFQTFQEASAAIDAMHNTMVDGATTRLQVRFARDNKIQDSKIQDPAQTLMYQQYQASYLGAATPYYPTPQTAPTTTGPYDYTQGAQFAYWTPEQQQQYMGMVQGMMGQSSTTSSAATATTAATAAGSEGNVCLFVMHIPNDWKDENLRTLFQEYGVTTQVKVMMDNATGQNKGYGFVNYGTQQEAQLACSSLNGYRIGHKYLKVSFKKPK